MARFNTKNAQATAAPKTRVTGPAVNHEGGPGFQHSQLGELYGLAVANFVGQDTFYEKGSDRDTRYNQLIEQVAVADWPWLSGMLPWLRSEANMRTASLMGAAHAVHARLAAGEYEGNAELIDAVIQRADEVAEFLAYWQHAYGRALPKAVRKGLEVAIQRLFNERNVLKWDSGARGLRMADVLNLVHAKPKTPRGEGDWQGRLFKYLLDERGHKDGDLSGVPMIAARKRWYDEFSDEQKLASLRDGSAFRDFGITWENASSELKSRIGEKALWEAMTPHLPYMAGIRNLRNMDEAGISYSTSAKLAARIADPEEVAKSRQLPFRFYTAYREAPSDRWKQALEEAVNASLKSVPELPGRTAVFVDTSGSMTWTKMSAKSSVMMAEVATLFGAILAQRNAGRVDLFGFASGLFRQQVTPGQGVLSLARQFANRFGEVGGGTEMTAAIRSGYNGHDRIFVISDMQVFADGGRKLSNWSKPDVVPVPDHVKVYGISPVGLRVTAIDTRLKGRFEFSGLNDQIFRQVVSLEAGYDEKWSWLA